eukprot:TRINITY_DN1935_c0_g1_i32.p1 TRINITY_DN1935_c0_g1~~TRINITY_DN1935_c0_g1_i32.p1  ORF type:complete len:156 (+),score=47.22 TRINITY_DN1935_c0_g1_i32:147-614(+)
MCIRDSFEGMREECAARVVLRSRLLLRAAQRCAVRGCWGGWSELAARTQHHVSGFRARVSLHALRYGWSAWYDVLAMQHAAQQLEHRRVANLAAGYVLTWTARAMVRGWRHSTEEAHKEHESQQRRLQMRSKVDGWLGEFRQKRGGGVAARAQRP